MARFSFPQYDGEPFYVYFHRLVEFLNYNGCNPCEACEICYCGMNEQTRYEVESRFNGEFQALTVHNAWSFFVRFAKDVRNRACNVANFDSQCDNSFIGGMNPHDLSCDPICEPNTSDFNSFSRIIDDESHLLDYA